jgi:hypothetical protein
MNLLTRTEKRPFKRLFMVCFLAWLSFLGVDFFLNTGVFARWYVHPNPALLAPEEAFRRIPLGYAAFLVWSVMLVWIAVRLDIRSGKGGAWFGFRLGVLFGAAGFLGQMSMFPLSPGILLSWAAGETVLFTVAGCVIGAGLAGIKLSRLFWMVVALILVLSVATIVMQNTGLAPAMRNP